MGIDLVTSFFDKNTLAHLIKAEVKDSLDIFSLLEISFSISTAASTIVGGTVSFSSLGSKAFNRIYIWLQIFENNFF
ncbi:MAG: hypothetical protein PHG49_02940 [Candidatus Pacebacteria bacterium]|nr:hypothetical protein [Candidatus Paceibacterota bacterium]